MRNSNSNPARTKSNFQPVIRRLGVAVLLSIGLVGCKSMTSTVHEASYTPRDHSNRIAVNRGDVTLKLPISASRRRISASHASEIEGFIQEYRNSGADSLSISRPVGSANQVAAAAAAAHIIRMLPRAGVSRRDAIATTYFAGRANPHAPVLLSFSRHYANVRECGDWSKNTANTYDNKPYRNFGCAHHSNLAAMVANPRDFARPRNEQPSDAVRRGVVIDKYRQGDVTVAEKAKEESGKVSDATE